MAAKSPFPKLISGLPSRHYSRSQGWLSQAKIINWCSWISHRSEGSAPCWSTMGHRGRRRDGTHDRHNACVP